jgi:hypothetical protein
MKDIFVIILIVFIVITIVYLINHSSKEKFSQNSKKKCEKGSDIKYVSLIDMLQCEYQLGIPSGKYIPVPIDRQPIDALPFNPGLEPCKFTLV